MKTNNLTSHDLLQTIYRARIEITNEKCYKYNPITVPAGPNVSMQHIEMGHERIIAIKLPESEYNKLLEGFGTYMDMIYGIENPIVRDMFEKLLMYIQLQK